MITYTKHEEDGKVILTKTGHSHTFTMDEVREHLAKLDKMEKELTSQKELEEAKMQNVEANHEIVKTLTDEQFAACGIYARAKEIHIACVQKLEQIAEARKEYAEDLKAIEEQTGEKL